MRASESKGACGKCERAAGVRRSDYMMTYECERGDVKGTDVYVYLPRPPPRHTGLIETSPRPADARGIQLAKKSSRPRTGILSPLDTCSLFQRTGRENAPVPAARWPVSCSLRGRPGCASTHACINARFGAVRLTHCAVPCHSAEKTSLYQRDGAADVPGR
jgi:hypothetical protein